MTKIDDNDAADIDDDHGNDDDDVVDAEEGVQDHHGWLSNS